MSDANKNIEDMDLEPLKEVFGRYDEVICAYVFGSVVKGKAGPLSDIDVALLLNNDAQIDEVALNIETELCRCLPQSNIDLTTLNEAPPSLSYRVLRDGVVLFVGDRKGKENFEVRTIMRYLDFQPIRRTAFEITRRKIVRGN